MSWQDTATELIDSNRHIKNATLTRRGDLVSFTLCRGNDLDLQLCVLHTPENVTLERSWARTDQYGKPQEGRKTRTVILEYDNPELKDIYNKVIDGIFIEFDD